MRIENKLTEFVWKMSQSEIFITEDVIFEKARRIQESFNALLPAGERTQLKFSNGWIARFKKRNGFKLIAATAKVETQMRAK